MDPFNGESTEEDLPSYSPAALVMMEYTWRLAGVCEQAEELQWNIRPGHPAAHSAYFRIATDAGRIAELQYDAPGAVLKLDDRMVASVQSGTVRLVTDKVAKPAALLGIHEQVQKVSLRLPGHPARNYTVLPNQRIAL